MKRMQYVWVFALLWMMSWASACASDSGSYAGNEMDFAPGKGDENYADGDTDVDADVAGNNNEDQTGTPPEVETTVNALMPKGAGRYVFVSDQVRDSVVVVDSETLEILTVEVGSKPTHLVTLPGEAPRVAVINLNSDDVTVIQMSSDQTFDTVDIPVRPDTNALVPSPDGRFIIAYHDPEQTAISGTPNTDQEISILRIVSGEERSLDQSVGIHPWKVIYNVDVTKAFVVTEGGINVVDLENYEDNVRAEPVALFEPGSYNSATADIEITPDGDLALGRKADDATLVAAFLDGSEEPRRYTLPSAPTDLDIAADGSFGVLVLRDQSEVVFFDLPLPEDPEADPFTFVSLGDRVAGLATLSESGNQLLLHTTAASDTVDLSRLTLMTREGDGWDISSAVLERSIKSVAIVNVDDEEPLTAVVEHQRTGTSDKPYGYSLVTLPNLMSKLQKLKTEPGQLLLTPDGEFGFLLLPDSKTAEKMDLDTLIVNQRPFSSPPIAAGYAAATDKVFVAQNHPAGRMSFIGVHDDSFKTVTGYNLNDEIEVSQ